MLRFNALQAGCLWWPHVPDDRGFVRERRRLLYAAMRAWNVRTSVMWRCRNMLVDFTIEHLTEQSNTVMQLTSTFAAQGVLRPPCSLRMLAADYHVGLVERA